MATGLDKFRKKWGSSINRAKKETKKAAEGHMLKEMATKKRAEESDRDKALKQFKEQGIELPVDKSFVICDTEFVSKMEADTRERVEMEMMNNLEAVVRQAVRDEMMGKLEMELKIQEAKNRELELKIQLAGLQSGSGGITEVEQSGNVTEVEQLPVTNQEKEILSKQIDKMFEGVPISNRKSRRTKVSTTLGHSKMLVINHSTPLRKGSRGFSIDWKKVSDEGRFNEVLIGILEYAKEQDIDVVNGKAFKSSGSTYNGAYQQFQLRNKGVKGAWRTFVEENVR